MQAMTVLIRRDAAAANDERAAAAAWGSGATFTRSSRP